MTAEIPGALLAALDAADSYTASHSAAVASYSYDLALAAGWSQARARWVHAGALLHDVGKIGVPDAVLNKEGRLDDDEWQQIRKHPELGANLIKRLPGFEVLEPAILYHHERLDGGGYPHGIAAEEIPAEAQIIAIADSYSAMTTDRAYRGARSAEHALRELRKDGAANRLNADLVEIFCALLVGRDEAYRAGEHTTLAAEVERVRGWLDLNAGTRSSS
jgi:putative two-component system response regulator